VRLAALGVNVFVSSGDAGSNPDSTGHSAGSRRGRIVTQIPHKTVQAGIRVSIEAEVVKLEPARLRVGLAEGRGLRILHRLNPRHEKAGQRACGEPNPKLPVDLAGDLPLAHAPAQQRFDQRA